MLLNVNGIAVRNPNAKGRWLVPMHVGRRHYTVEIPADDEHEAIVIAENEAKFGVWTCKPCKKLA